MTAKRTPTKYAGIYKRETARGPRYDLTFRDPDGKLVWRTTRTLAEARAAKREAERGVERGQYVDDRAKTTVGQYARVYLDSRHDQRPTTRVRQLSMVEHHIEPTALGGMPLVRVRREDVDQWLADRAAVLSRSTLRTVASLLRSVLRYAVENNRLVVAPVVRISGRQTDVGDSRVYAPSVDEVRALAAAMRSDVNKALVLVQAGTGLRISELLALRVCDVSTTFRSVKVVAQLSRKGERIPTKTPESERTVPLSGAVAAVIAPLLKGKSDEGLVFAWPDGSPIRQNTYHVAFKRAVEVANLPATLSSHDLRHHYATTLLRGGLSPVAVGRLLGHTDGSLVVKTYAHWLPADDDLARAALDAAWSGQQPRRLRSAPQGDRSLEGR